MCVCVCVCVCVCDLQVNNFLLRLFLNEPELICLNGWKYIYLMFTHNCFQVFLKL